MAHALTVELPDDVYEPLLARAREAGGTPEDLAVEWIARRTDGSNRDAIPQIVAEAIEYILQDRIEAACRRLEGLSRPAVPVRTSRTISRTNQLHVFHRDQFTCRYCGKETIFVPVLRVLSSLSPDQVPYHANWKWTDCHPLYWTHGTSCDHVLPVARGGTSEACNLVTTCYMCNSIKQNWLLDELRWDLLPPVSSDWRGLTGSYPILCEHTRLNTDPYHRVWLRALVGTAL